MKKHGKSNTSAYRSWNCMKERCNNPNSSNYRNYGGRGIKICERWLNSFENFYEDMGDRPLNMTLDRIDNNKNYYKENCKWSTNKQQFRNKTNSRFIEFNGEKACLAEFNFQKNVLKIKRILLLVLIELV